MHKEISTVTYRDCYTKGMVHNELVTYGTLWHRVCYTKDGPLIVEGGGEGTCSQGYAVTAKLVRCEPQQGDSKRRTIAGSVDRNGFFFFLSLS